MGFDVKSIKSDFIFIALDYDKIKENENNSLQKFNIIYNKLARKYGMILSNNPILLSKDEEEEFTKECIKSKYCKLIIFALDDEFELKPHSGLKAAYNFCDEKDYAFANKNKKGESLRTLGGFGFPRMILGLGGDSATIIKRLNDSAMDMTNFGLTETFYSSASIIYNINSLSPDELFNKYTSAIDLLNIGFTHYTAKLHKKAKYYEMSEKSVLTNKFKIRGKMNVVHLDNLTVKNYELIKKNFKNVVVLYDSIDQNVEIEDKYSDNFYYAYPLLIIKYNTKIENPLSTFIETTAQNGFVSRSKNKRYVKSQRNYLKKDITFISYSHRDDADKHITHLAEDMKTLGLNVFFDNLDFLPGKDWDKMALEVIEGSNCDKMLAIVDEGYLHSKPCMVEKERFLNDKNKTLYFYDPKGLLNNEVSKTKKKKKQKISIETINKALASIDPIHEKCNKKAKGKIVILKNRNDILSCYDMEAMNNVILQRKINYKYDIALFGSVKRDYLFDVPSLPKTQTIYCKKAPGHLTLKFDGQEIIIQKYKNHAQRFFNADEEIDLFTKDISKITKKTKEHRYTKTFFRIIALLLVITTIVYALFGKDFAVANENIFDWIFMGGFLTLAVLQPLMQCVVCSEDRSNFLKNRYLNSYMYTRLFSGFAFIVYYFMKMSFEEFFNFDNIDNEELNAIKSIGIIYLIPVILSCILLIITCINVAGRKRSIGKFNFIFGYSIFIGIYLTLLAFIGMYKGASFPYLFIPALVAVLAIDIIVPLVIVGYKKASKKEEATFYIEEYKKINKL